LHIVSTENTYEFNFQFADDVGYKDIRCVIVRLKDTTSNEIVGHTTFVNHGRGHYPAEITLSFKDQAENYMDHNYDLMAILNVDWCSLDSGEPRTRAGDMNARKLKGVYGLLKDDDFMHYAFKVDMEHVK